MVSRNPVFISGLFLMTVSICGLKSVTSAVINDSLLTRQGLNDLELIEFEKKINELKENITEMNEHMKQMAADIENPKISKLILVMLLRSSEVYIRNVGENYYLGAQLQADNKHTLETNSVEKANPSYSSFKWSFEHENDDIFTIKNVKYEKYLSSSLETPQNECRDVGLFTHDNSVGNSGKWEVTFDGYKIQIKNVLLNEYFVSGYSISNTGDDFYICTLTTGTTTGNTLWEIEF